MKQLIYFRLLQSGFSKSFIANFIKEQDRLVANNGKEFTVDRLKEFKTYVLNPKIKPTKFSLHKDGSPKGLFRHVYRTIVNSTKWSERFNVLMFYTIYRNTRVTKKQLDKFLGAVERPLPFKHHYAPPRLFDVKINSSITKYCDRLPMFEDAVIQRTGSGAPRMILDSRRCFHTADIASLTRRQIGRISTNPAREFVIQESDDSFLEDQLYILRSKAFEFLFNRGNPIETNTRDSLPTGLDILRRMGKLASQDVKAPRRAPRLVANPKATVIDLVNPAHGHKTIISAKERLKSYILSKTSFMPVEKSWTLPKNKILADFVGVVQVDQQEGCKGRFYGSPNRFINHILDPLRNFLKDILLQIPEDCTYEQSKPDEILRDLSSIKGFTFNSVDLTNASDTLPLAHQIDLVRKLYQKWHHNKVCNDGVLLEALLLLVREVSKGKWRLATKEYWEETRWVKGQVLGLRPSFNLFTLYHHGIIQGVMIKEGIPRFGYYFKSPDSNIVVLVPRQVVYKLLKSNTWRQLHDAGYRKFPAYFVLGDDIIILNSRLLAGYLAQLKGIGVEYSESKTLLNSPFAEFAGFVYFQGERLNTLKFKALTLLNEDIFLTTYGHKYLPFVRGNKLFRAYISLKSWLPDFLGGFGFNPHGVSLSERLSFLKPESLRTLVPRNSDTQKRSTRILKLKYSRLLKCVREIQHIDLNRHVSSLIEDVQSQLGYNINEKFAHVATESSLVELLNHRIERDYELWLSKEPLSVKRTYENLVKSHLSVLGKDGFKTLLPEIQPRSRTTDIRQAFIRLLEKFW